MRFGALRIQYFLLYAVIGAYLPYIPLHLRELGFSASQVGWVIGVYGLAVVLMPTLITHLADRRLGHRGMIGVGFGAAAVVLGAIAVVDNFVGLMALSLAFSLCYTPMFSLTDGMTFSTFAQVEEAGRRAPPYYTLRIWGSFGFMAPAVLIFFVLHYTGCSSVWAIVVASGCAALAALTSLRLPHTSPAGRGQLELPSVAAWRALRRRPVIHLVGPLFLLAVAINMYYAFYSIYLTDLGITPQWVGLIINLGVAAEIGLMFFAGPLLRRFGLRTVMIMGAVAMTLRMALLAGLPTPGVVIGSQLLHAPIVLAFYLVPPMYLNHKAGPTFRNSMQGLYSMICYGTTRLVGSIVGGYVSEISLQATFTLAGAISLVASVWLIIAFHDTSACDAIRRQHERIIEPAIVEA